MAGCKCDKETYRITYDDVAKSVIEEHTDWAPTQVRHEAARIFRPQYRQNAESVHKELSGEKEYEGTSFLYDTQHGIRFINGDTTVGLLELHERQLRLTPDTYSTEEHQTSLLIEQAFQNGATKIVTSYLQSAGQRDLVVMTLDRETGKGRMRIINTVTDHTMSEMQNLAKKNFAHLSEVHPATNAFILSDIHISKEQIQQKFTTLDQRVHTVLKETVGAAKNTIREIRYTTDSVRQFVQRSHDERLEAHPDVIGESFIHRVRRMFEHKEDRKREALVFQHQPVKKQEINLIGRSVERVKQTRRQVQEKITTSIATLLFVRATGVAIGGAFVPLESIIRPPQISLESPKRIKKEKQRKQKRIPEKTRVFRTGEQRVLRRKEKTLRVKEKKILQHKERKSIRRKENLLRNVLKRLVQQTERQFMSKKIKQKEKLGKINVAKKEKQTVVTFKERPTRRKEKRHVIEFSVALVIWILLHMQTSSRPAKEKKHEMSLIKPKKSKELVLKEPTSWVLFAIVWHLAMIREGGMRTVHRQKKAKKQVKQYYSASIPPQGVIFAFAS